MNKTARRKNTLFTIAVILLIALILAVTGNIAYKFLKHQYLLNTNPIKYEEYVEKYSSENGVDKFLIYAIIKTESNFDPNAVSNVGARGLMQIMEDTFEWIKFRLDDGDELNYDSMFEPEQNIRYGCYLVGYLIKHFELLEPAVCAYHAGIGKVDSWLEDSYYSSDGRNLDVIPISDTEHYLKKIKNTLNIYNQLYMEEN